MLRRIQTAHLTAPASRCTWSSTDWILPENSCWLTTALVITTVGESNLERTRMSPKRGAAHLGRAARSGCDDYVGDSSYPGFPRNSLGGPIGSSVMRTTVPLAQNRQLTYRWNQNHNSTSTHSISSILTMYIYSRTPKEACYLVETLKFWCWKTGTI